MDKNTSKSLASYHINYRLISSAVKKDNSA
uniref:Uncharacterized protein n=1 Tax=Rhizophora mucronata TaxID=61149 RepID=A0A2P2NDZ5_RHIMU